MDFFTNTVMNLFRANQNHSVNTTINSTNSTINSNNITTTICNNTTHTYTYINKYEVIQISYMEQSG